MQELLNRTNSSRMTYQNLGSSMWIFIDSCVIIYCTIQEDSHSKLSYAENFITKQARADKDN